MVAGGQNPTVRMEFEASPSFTLLWSTSVHSPHFSVCLFNGELDQSSKNLSRILRLYFTRKLQGIESQTERLPAPSLARKLLGVETKPTSF